LVVKSPQTQINKINKLTWFLNSVTRGFKYCSGASSCDLVQRRIVGIAITISDKDFSSTGMKTIQISKIFVQFEIFGHEFSANLIDVATSTCAGINANLAAYKQNQNW
jgi:hypothetical protein